MSERLRPNLRSKYRVHRS